MMNNLFDPWTVYQSAQTYTENRGFEVFLHADKTYRKSLTTALSNYLELISKTIKRIQPDLELSVAVKPDPIEAKHRYFQDWLIWLKNDYCDFVAIMNYRTEWEEFSFVLEELKRQNLNEKIIVGISTYNQDVDAVLKRLVAVKEGEFVGFSLFSYNHLIENREYLIKLEREIIVGKQ
jgi:uncharacterized lipoprotein YddW (UPF0748 family)